MKYLFLLVLIPFFTNAQLGFKDQTIKANDSLVINTTSMKLFCMFDTRDSLNNNLRFPEPLDGNVKICGNQSKVLIYAGGITIELKAKGVFLDTVSNFKCKKDIVTHQFGGSRRMKELDDGDYEISFDLNKKYIKTNFGTIEVSPQELQCDDTGTNPFRIISKGKDIVFKEGGNLIFFEFDSNQDQKKELYIVNYFSCMRRIELYKIQ